MHLGSDPASNRSADFRGPNIVTEFFARRRRLFTQALVGEPLKSTALVWRRARPPRRGFAFMTIRTDVDVRPAETIWFQAADGRDSGLVVKPHGFDPA